MSLFKTVWSAITDLGKPDIRRTDMGPVVSQVKPQSPTAPQPASRAEVKPAPPLRKVIIQTSESFADKLRDATSIEECLALYQSETEGSANETLAASKLAKLAVDSDDWLAIFDGTAVGSPLAKQAVERLLALATSYDVAETLSDRFESDKALAEELQKAVAAMSRYATDFSHWVKIYRLAQRQSDPEKLAFAKICELASDSSEWDEAVTDLPDGDPLYAKALEWRLGKSTTLDEFESLFDELESDSPFIAGVVEKASKCDEPCEKWIEMYAGRSDLNDFSNMLLDRAIALAKTPDHWVSLVEATDNSHDDDTKEALEAIEKVVFTEEQWAEIRDGTQVDALENIAFIHLIRAKKTVDGALELYLDYQDNYSTDSDVLDKMFEHIFSLATPSEVKIIARLTGDDDLRTAAESRLAAN